MDLKNYIRSIPDFPKPGINFRDITTLIQNPSAFSKTIDILHERYKPMRIDLVAGIEARGFIFGAALAYKLGVGFVPIRKKGKLPWKTVSESYKLEYGTDTIEVHEDAIKKGQNILLLDDLIATGGSLLAASKLLEKLDGNILEAVVVIELVDLKGREKIAPLNLFSLVKFEGD